MTWDLPFIPAGGSAGITICDATKKQAHRMSTWSVRLVVN